MRRLVTLFLVLCAGAVALVPLPLLTEFARAVVPDLLYVRPPLVERLKAQNLSLGQPVFIRIFKAESTLEVWLKEAGQFRLFAQYPICRWSGELGPKLAEGDLQAPEGIYAVTLDRLNPGSRFHLAMNIGYPNAHDRALGRTGSAIMIHGNCVSIGCFAMTDTGIDDIYALAEAALRGGSRSVPVHIFPFRMSADNMARHASGAWAGFWQDLKPVHDHFEATRLVPAVRQRAGRYRLDED